MQKLHISEVGWRPELSRTHVYGLPSYSPQPRPIIIYLCDIFLYFTTSQTTYIATDRRMTIFRLFKQIWSRPPAPTTDFSGKTVIVTGANVGLGKEAVKHFVRRGAARVIATIRSRAKGEAALAEIEADTQLPGVAEIWELDYSSYASVKDFCARVARLDRVDAVILNAGVATKTFETFEGDESSLTVNVIRTTLLALLLIPILRTSAAAWNTVPTLAITGSEIHSWAKFPERNAYNSLQALSDPNNTSMNERYAPSPVFICKFSFYHLYYTRSSSLLSAFEATRSQSFYSSSQCERSQNAPLIRSLSYSSTPSVQGFASRA